MILCLFIVFSLWISLGICSSCSFEPLAERKKHPFLQYSCNTVDGFSDAAFFRSQVHGSRRCVSHGLGTSAHPAFVTKFTSSSGYEKVSFNSVQADLHSFPTTGYYGGLKPYAIYPTDK